MQRKFLFLVVLLLMVAGCGGEGEEEAPEALPTLAGETDGEESPRALPTPPRNLPPTWTPPGAVPVPAGETPAPDATGEPEEAGSVEPDDNDELYVVQAGDTLAEIAIDFGVDLEVLIQVNNIQNMDHIEVGQELVIPRD